MQRPTVNNQLRLGDFSTTPLYNIKAVVQATDISSSTLRAWERRYNMCAPQRSESGYRLYSDRDIAIIRWLKLQVDAGMSISQAVAWLDKLTKEAGGQESVLLPSAGDDLAGTRVAPPVRQSAVRALPILQRELLQVLLNFDEVSANQLMDEAFALYTVERVGEELVKPLLVEVGERWHQGEASVTAEHYISNYLTQRLMALLHAAPAANRGPEIWVGCAPGEMHEIGPLLLALFLRRAGFQTRYLGPNLLAEDLVREVQHKRPAAVLFSASSEGTAGELQEIAARLVNLESGSPLVGIGGRIYNEAAHLRGGSAGIFLGNSALEAVEAVGELLRNGSRADARPHAPSARQPSQSSGPAQSLL